MIIVKLGGSVITHKDRPFSPNLKVLYDAAKAIADYWIENPNQDFFIIHGGGSFAHVAASLHAFSLSSENGKGLSLITWSARKLNDRVIESLVDYNLPVFPLQTSSVFFLRKDMIEMNKNIIECVIKNGWVPVLYGDIILGDKEAQIMSGEKIIESLSREFDIKRIIICTDKPGVLIDINRPEKGIIESINSSNIANVARALGSSSALDVTGGMKHKVETLYNIAKEKGTPSIIIDGTDPRNIYACLSNQNVTGTLVREHHKDER